MCLWWDMGGSIDCFHKGEYGVQVMIRIMITVFRLPCLVMTPDVVHMIVHTFVIFLFVQFIMGITKERFSLKGQCQETFCFWYQVRWWHYEDEGWGKNLPPVPRYISGIAGRCKVAASGKLRTELQVWLQVPTSPALESLTIPLSVGLVWRAFDHKSYYGGRRKSYDDSPLLHLMVAARHSHGFNAKTTFRILQIFLFYAFFPTT